MTLSRGIRLPLHGAIEMIAAPIVMVAPFLLGFERTAAIVAVVYGALLIALAVQVESPSRVVPISAHAGFDYMLAAFVAFSGLAIGISSNAWPEATFLVGVGVAQVMLTASTRFSIGRVAP